MERTPTLVTVLPAALLAGSITIINAAGRAGAGPESVEPRDVGHGGVTMRATARSTAPRT